MKLALRPFVCAILLLACAAPLAAQSDTSFANGEIKFPSGGGTALIRFSARQNVVSGAMSGHIDFSGPVEVTPGNFVDVTMTVDVNCVQIAITDASMSGTVTSSSLPALVGTQSLLTVEDNGQGQESPPDRYTWVMTSAADCHSFPPPSQDVTDGHVHVKPSNTPFF